MATINKELAENIIANDGFYTSSTGERDSTRMVKVVTYKNMFDGSLTYACVSPRDHINKYELSPACEDVKVLWTFKGPKVKEEKNEWNS